MQGQGWQRLWEGQTKAGSAEASCGTGKSTWAFAYLALYFSTAGATGAASLLWIFILLLECSLHYVVCLPFLVPFLALVTSVHLPFLGSMLIWFVALSYGRNEPGTPIVWIAIVDNSILCLFDLVWADFGLGPLLNALAS